jgi:D-alanyl-D-alanine carboxypeptidase (penicillin-binding protein 5/6)
MRRAAQCIAIGLCLVVLSWGPSVGASPAPGTRPPGTAHLPGPPGAASTVLIEVQTGQVLESVRPHRRLPPASLDKLMTFYLTLEALKAKRLALTTNVTVSETAWRVGRTKGSSRMFLNVGDVVTVEQLLHGLMIASGNDAAEALAETLGGTGEQFVEQMNATAARLGMRDTHFVTPHGLPSPGEYTSAGDMALVARQILVAYPDAVTYTSPRYEMYGGIRQANWNNLIFRDPRVDGLKTGFTDESGFHIVATAREGTLRFVAVVMGAHKLQERTGIATRLLNVGFSRYALVTVPWQRVVPSSFTIYGGNAPSVTVDTPQPVVLLLPKDDHTVLTVSEELSVAPVAPFRKGQPVGVLTIRTSEAQVTTSPLVASTGVDRAQMFARLWGMLRYKIAGVFHKRTAVWTGTYSASQ